MATRGYKISTLDEDDCLVLTITEQTPKRTKRDHYLLRANPNERGAFRLMKSPDVEDTGVKVYDVSTLHRTCDCPGGEQHGRCKHLEAITVLLEEGRLTWPNQNA